MNWLIIPTKMDTKQFDKQIEYIKQQMEEIDEKLKQADTGIEVGDTSKLEQQYEKLNNQLNEYQRKQNEINNKGFRNSIKDIDNVNNSMTKIINKVGKWVLAIFSVRSAYMMVRRSVSILTQYDEQLKSDIENISYQLAYSMKPIIEGIVNLVYKVLGYVDYIANAWFGVSLFSNKTASNISNANKSAKELKKTMAGFDEANVLSINQSTSTGGGTSTPTPRSVGIEGNVPKWLQWIGDNKEAILTTIGAVSGLIVLFKGANLINTIGGLFGGSLASGGTGLIALKELLAIIGTTVLVTIAVKGIKEVINQAKELKGRLIDLNSQSQNNSDKNKELTKTYSDLARQNKLTQDQLDLYNNYLNKNIDTVIGQIETMEEQKSLFGALTGQNKELTKNQQLLTTEIYSTMWGYSDLYEQGKLSVEQQEQYRQALQKSIEFLNKNGESTDGLRRKYKELTGQDYVINVKAKADTKQASKDYSNFFSNLGNSISTIFSAGVSGVASGLVSKIKNIWFATGGIVNMPGRGVPIGYNVRAGESGAEGVIPLTDSQAMETLGQTIAKYVNINNIVDVNFDSKKVNRILAESQNRQSIESNGGGY